MKPVVHHSISDLYQTLNLAVGQDIEFTILSIPDIHPHIPFASPALRADYFSFIFTKDGSGAYYLDDHKFPFHARSIYFTNPGHTKSYELTYSKEAYIIVLTETFLRQYVHPDIYTAFPFLLSETVPPKTLTDQAFKVFETLYQQIQTEFEGDSAYKYQIIGNLFAVLLLKIKEDFWVDYDPLEEGKRDSQIVKFFKQLLEEKFRIIGDEAAQQSRPRVKDFAEELHLHPNYLNSVIKSKTGKTVNEWLTSRTLIAGRYLLTTTKLSTKEIAYRLGFSEPTHFNRFFKQHMEMTPGAFRKTPGPSK